ncbi:DUF3015 family protein [Yoonia sp. R2-816]|uniref:DUF3015 family protein n=1 Tax=Yoonia sp. R2-816 TaxID=3342638 RepID=UPI003727C34A
MKKLNTMMMCTAMAFASSISVANAQEINPWQDCGVGAMVFPNNGAASAISNIVWDWGTTAVSSALSSPDQCQGSTVQVAAFVRLGYDHISRETVVGDGEYLQTLMAGINCDPAIQPALLADVRDGFAAQLQDTDFSAKDDSGKAEAYFLGLRDVVQTNYADSCESF